MISRRVSVVKCRGLSLFSMQISSSSWEIHVPLFVIGTIGHANKVQMAPVPSSLQAHVLHSSLKVVFAIQTCCGPEGTNNRSIVIDYRNDISIISKTIMTISWRFQWIRIYVTSYLGATCCSPAFIANTRVAIFHEGTVGDTDLFLTWVRIEKIYRFKSALYSQR